MTRIGDNTAGPQAAGYILQLDRALYHLATATSAQDVVAIEHVDDVVVLRDGKLVLAEQDKSTSRSTSKILGDRSRALWRTLQIWLGIEESNEGVNCRRYLLFVNRWNPTPLAELLRERTTLGIPALDIVAALRQAGGRPGKSKVGLLISDVLSRDDAALASLVEKIEIVVAGSDVDVQATLANGLAFHPHVDVDTIVYGLLGWLTTKVRAEWSEGRPALVSRREIVLQCHVLQDLQKKSRFLPRPSREISLSNDEREQALARNFVGHLDRILADREDIVQAIDHFLRFSIEKYRLVKAGDVPSDEWMNRSDRLRERWQNIMRRKLREMKHDEPSLIGLAVLAETTYEHRESLDGYPCDELYMTSGNYHRLAEGDEVWWHPEFTRGVEDEG